MRLKRNDNRPESTPDSTGDQMSKNLHMAAVDTVKVADGQHRILKRFRTYVRTGHYPHESSP
jgi:translation initiation factor 2B subunit (eIF-2B alpha/beta/delta family)